MGPEFGKTGKPQDEPREEKDSCQMEIGGEKVLDFCLFVFFFNIEILGTIW